MTAPRPPFAHRNANSDLASQTMLLPRPSSRVTSSLRSTSIVFVHRPSSSLSRLPHPLAPLQSTATDVLCNAVPLRSRAELACIPGRIEHSSSNLCSKWISESRSAMQPVHVSNLFAGQRQLKVCMRIVTYIAATTLGRVIIS
jgi:hypothetical protein